MRFFSLVIFTFLTFCVNSQLVVDTNITVTNLVNKHVSSTNVLVSNTTYRGEPNQRGEFNGTKSNIGIDSGIILSTGHIDSAVGPNDSDGTAFNPAPFITAQHDPDLVSIAGPNVDSLYDIVVLEFDFIAQGDSILFNFVFASEEYLQFVNQGFNDPFGLFLSGPGINGTFTNNAVNIALVPGTNLPISIDNINNITNSQFYIDNGDGFSGSPQFTDPTVVQFNGFTTKLTASYPIQCGLQYHIKLALGDVSDENYNSAVFIESSSFASNKITGIQAALSSSLDTICKGDSVLLTASSLSANLFEINPSIFNDTGTFKIAPDTTTTYEFIATFGNNCGDTIRDTVYHTIYVDSIGTPILFSADTLFGCGIPFPVNFQNMTNNPNLNWEWDFGDGSTSALNSPQHSYTNFGCFDVKLIASTNFCRDSLERQQYICIEQKNINLQTTLTANKDTICKGDSVILSAASVGGKFFQFNHGLPNDTGNYTVIPDTTTTYQFISIYSNICGDTTRDTAYYTVYVDSIGVPILFDADPLFGCGIPFEVNFQNATNNPDLNWEWDFGDGTTSALNSPQHTYTNFGCFDIRLIGFTNHCRDTLIRQQYICVYNPPQIDFTYSPNPVIVNNDVTFTSSVLDFPSYTWTLSSDLISNDSVFIHNFATTDSTTVCLSIIDENNCRDTICKEIDFDREIFVFVPNTFTPNGDGLNDLFIPVFSDEIESYTISIYNRWGGLVFESDNISNAWKGTYNGTECPIGTYVYKIKYRKKKGRSQDVIGSINLIR